MQYKYILILVLISRSNTKKREVEKYDLKLDNLCAFRNFHVNFSYPKKIVNSYIEHEHLDGLPNFRYKKVNIIMGSNATGKTSLGRLILSIFILIGKRNT